MNGEMLSEVNDQFSVFREAHFVTFYFLLNLSYFPFLHHFKHFIIC